MLLAKMEKRENRIREGLEKAEEAERNAAELDDGLAYSSVTSVAQDRDGSMWFATFGGVSRYDNHAFSIYSGDGSFAPEGVHLIYRCSDGTIWFARGALLSGGTGVSR